jgi:serine/threonine protein kinase
LKLVEVQDQNQIAGRYALIERIGEGGSGVVWRARDLLLRREVAMKELSLPASVDEHERRRLQQSVLREARAAARLHHPGAVAVFDVVDDGERQFIVMELVDAPNLSQVVNRGGPLDPIRTASLGLELLEVLEAAHRSGIVHRDVKPGNVLVPVSGRVRLGDFGIASLIDDPSITATGMLKGTPSYMSPEQAMAGAIGSATDLWSLGATLYFAVEGHAPFDKGQPIPTLAAIALEDPQPFVLAGSLAPVLEPLFAKDPVDRPEYASLRRGLRSVAAKQAPPVSREPTVQQRPPIPPAPPVEQAPPDVRTPPEVQTPPVVQAPPVKQAPPGGSPPPAPRTTKPVSVSPRPHAARQRRATRWGMPVALVAIVVLIIGFAALVRPGTSGIKGAGRPPVTGTVPVPAPTSAAATTARPQGSAPTAAVPAGWTSYTDPGVGFRLAYPPTWNVERHGTLTDFRDPASATYVRIDHQSPPAATPDGPWYALEPAFAAANPGYQRIGITRTTFHGYPAAIWEYTYRSDGQQLHAIDLGGIAGDHGFAFNFQTTDAAWSQRQSLLNSLEDAFQP